MKITIGAPKIEVTVLIFSSSGANAIRAIRSHPIQNTAPPRNVAGITTSGFAVPRRCLIRYGTAIHLNDSMMPFGSRKDRHAVIGGGEIGMEALLNVMRHPKLKDLPFYLETPLDDAGHKEEIARLRDLA